MFRKRHLLPLALAALLGGAGSSTAPASAAGTRAVHVELPAAPFCAMDLTLDFTIPATTAPGETIQVTDLSARFSWRTGVTTMPGTPIPSRATPTIDRLGFKVEGAAPASLSFPDLPRTLAPSPVTDRLSTGYGFDAVAGPLGDSSSTVTAGSGPVVLRLEQFDVTTLFEEFSSGGGLPGPPPPGIRPMDCRPWPQLPVLAVIPSTAPVPAAPAITSLSKTSGPMRGGETITLTGTNLAYASFLGITGNMGSTNFVVKDDQTIEFTTPRVFMPGPVTITVTSAFGQSGPLTYTYLAGPPPSITAVSPNRFPTTAGNLDVTVTGVNVDRVNWGALGSYPQSTVQFLSGSDDGTTTRLRFSQDDDWTAGQPSRRLRIPASYSIACGQTQGPCEVQPTDASVLTFYEPTTDLPGFPTAPTGLTATRVPDHIEATWNAAPAQQGVERYEVFVNGRSVARTTETSFRVRASAASAERVSVRAIDGDGERSLQSAEVLSPGTQPDTTAPATPAAPTVTGEYDPKGAFLSWNYPSSGESSLGWEVYMDGVKVATARVPGAALSDLDPAVEHRFAIRAFDPTGNVSPLSPEVTLQPRYDFAVAGSAALTTLVTRPLPLTGSVKGFVVNPATDTVRADVLFAPTKAGLLALGFLPVEVHLQIVPTTPLTGSLRDGVLRSALRARIKIPKVTIFGMPVGVDTNCQARQATSIALNSSRDRFTVATGGRLLGSFAISNLTGCGSGLLNPLIAKPSNPIALSLARAANG